MLLTIVPSSSQSQDMPQNQIAVWQHVSRHNHVVQHHIRYGRRLHMPLLETCPCLDQLIMNASQVKSSQQVSTLVHHQALPAPALTLPPGQPQQP